MTNKIERRNFDFDIQNHAENKKIVEGYAAKFNRYLLFRTSEKEYFEEIDSHAFDGADISNVIMQYDHCGRVYARTSNKTLDVFLDETGLKIRADLSKSRAAEELFEEIKNGLVTKMSFAFDVLESSFDKETSTFKIRKIGKVYDVSAVSLPANDYTEIQARSQVVDVIKQQLLLKIKFNLNNERD